MPPDRPAGPTRPAAVERTPRSGAQRSTDRPALSLDAIVTRTLVIVDAEGVDAVSMRRVAAEFDTGPASLYAYVRDKQGLLRLTLERVLAEIPPPTGDTWQEQLRNHAHQVRALLSRHNDLARLTFGVIPTVPSLLRVMDRLLGAMVEAGVPRQVAAWALDILALHVTADVYEGWVFGRTFTDGSGRPPEEVGREYFDQVAAGIAALPRGGFPHLTASIDALMAGGSDERFAFGVDMLIAGFAAQVPAPDPTDG